MALLTEIGLLVVWAFGVWQVFEQPDHGRRADRLPRLHQPLLHAAGVDEPHRLGHAAGGRQRQRIFEILDRVPSVPEPAQPGASRAACEGAIELRDVGFRYGNRSVIRRTST